MTPKSHMTTKLYRRCRWLTAAPVWLFICTPNRRGPEERRHRRIRITSVPARASVSTLDFASFHGSKSVHAPHRPQSAGRGFNPGPAPVDDLMPSLRVHSIRAHAIRPKLKSPSNGLHLVNKMLKMVIIVFHIRYSSFSFLSSTHLLPRLIKCLLFYELLPLLFVFLTKFAQQFIP